MSLYCFTVFSVLEEHLDLFPSASWRGGDARLIWLQSCMWLCLYCSCSCSPRGTVIWRWERAVTWKWPLKIKQLSLSPVSQGKRKKWHAETSVWSKKNSEVSREQLDLWMELEVRVWRGQRRKKERVWGKRKRRLTQIRQQRRPSPVIWLEVFWTCCAWRGKHIIICCIPSTHMSQISTGHQRRV